MRVLLSTLSVILILTATALTFPRFAVEQSVSCGQCHINPTGGGMRNEYGNFSVALQELSLQATKDEAVKRYRSPRISDALLIGFDSRYLVFDDGRVFRMQTDLFTAVQPFDGFTYQFRFWENGIFENYALFQFSQDRHYIKAGRFYPAFGLKVPDHTAFIRQRSGHGSNLYLDGISVGTSFNNINVVGELFDNNNRTIAGAHIIANRYLEPVSIFAGLSFRHSETIENSNGSFPHAKALFGGLAYDRFTLMGEINLVGKSNDTLISYLNLTSRLMYGLYAVGEYNFFDGNRDIVDGTEEFLRFSVEFYPISFVQIRPSYTYYTKGYLKDEDDLFVQLHIGY